ncbi:hypothetical protein BGX34_005602, partial [Mortierella sp. NVP85]
MSLTTDLLAFPEPSQGPVHATAAGLKPLEDQFDAFVVQLRCYHPFPDPIRKPLLPKGATMVEPTRDDPSRGLVYLVPYFKEYERWIEDYGESTGAKFKMTTRKEPILGRPTRDMYYCDQNLVFKSTGTGCEGRIAITLPKVGDSDTMKIEIFGHTKHRRAPSDDSRTETLKKVHDFIGTCIRNTLMSKASLYLSKKRALEMKRFRETLVQRAPIRYQGVWEISVPVESVYDIWKELVGRQNRENCRNKSTRGAKPVIRRTNPMTRQNMEKEDQARQERALDVMEGVKRVSEGCWSVASSENPERLYQVQNGRSGMTCTCKDFETRRGKPCKHVYAVMLHSTPERTRQDVVAREVIDLTEDDAGSAAVETAPTRDDDTMAE